MALKSKPSRTDKDSLTKKEEDDLARSLDDLKAGKYKLYRNFNDFKKEHEKMMKKED